ncbi:hypothetical protein [Dyadobacter sp. NIV53]|uniref:hypothetical protein n=1 Tax=Dyadobacter sp. NIV53 TaxID=2861765 RepID=UPI001C87735C|nr:hypothetical protein [Dyadobacter sp. NIV53]
MKKVIINAGIIFLILSGAAYAQSTTISTNPNGASTDKSQGSTVGNKKTTDGTHDPNSKTSNTASPKGRATNAGSRTNPGGESGTKASIGGEAGNNPKGASAATNKSTKPITGSGTGKNVGGKSDSKSAGSAAPSRAAAGGIGQGGAAVADGKLKPGAVVVDKQKGASNYKGSAIKPAEGVKDGSGSSERNTKNKTGVTGNESNRATKRNN